METLQAWQIIKDFGETIVPELREGIAAVRHDLHTLRHEMLTHFANLDQCLSEISAEIHALNGSVSRIEIAIEEDRAARKKL